MVGFATTVLSLLATAVVADIVPGAYIFEFEDNVKLSSRAAASALAQAIEKEGSIRLDIDYKLFKGASVQLNDLSKADSIAEKIAQLPTIKNMWPLRTFSLDDPRVTVIGDLEKSDQTVAPRDEQSPYGPHVMTQIDKLHKMGITGEKSTKIAVVDTGIDYKHPALGGCFGPGCLVAFGTDFVGDEYTGSATKPKPKADPLDCGGHGSHVAGIIAAQSNPWGFIGAAPNVTLGAYKVFGCSGQVTSDILVSAFNRAFEDGADIITASIGGASGWSNDAWATAISRIADQGVPCTISQGNSGSFGLFYASSGASGKSAISLASFDSTDLPVANYFSAYSVDGGEKVDFGFTIGSPSAWDNVKLPLWATTFDTNVADDACKPLPDNTPDLSGFVVLVRRGGCAFADKGNNLAAKGAKYALVYNNVAGSFNPSFGDAEAKYKAVGMTDPQAGATLIGHLKAGKKVTMIMAGFATAKLSVTTVPNNVTGGALSTFTSWGPTWNMEFKPQLGAVGGNVLSTYPRAKGSYAVLSGTSMACPMAAGVLGLLRQVRGPLDTRVITNLLATTANPQLFNDGLKFYGKLAPAPQQGGGLIQAYDAAFATTLLDPASFSFNDTENAVTSKTFTITNTGEEAVTYELGQVSAFTMYTLAKDSIYPAGQFNEAVDASASISFNKNSIKLDPGSRSIVTVTPTPPVGVDAKRLAVWSGYITVNGTDGSSLSLPYQGLSGSLRQATSIGPKDQWIALSNDKDNKPVAENTTFVLPPPGKATNADVLPALAYKLALGSAKLRFFIVPMTTCPPKNLTREEFGFKTIGEPYGTPYILNPRGINTAVWDGRLSDGGKFAPAGKYKVIVRALKVFGDEKNEKDWDTASGPRFIIKYKEN